MGSEVFEMTGATRANKNVMDPEPRHRTQNQNHVMKFHDKAFSGKDR